MPDQVLANCLLFAGTARAPLPDHGVWIGADGTIRAVGPSDDIVRAAPGGRIVDLGGDCVLPGLVNMHVHVVLALPGDMQAAVHGASDAQLALLIDTAHDWGRKVAAHAGPAPVIERALSAGPRHWESLQHALRNGVPIAMGSDMPPHAPFDGTTATVRELEFMVDAGMPAAEALLSATVRPIEWRRHGPARHRGGGQARGPDRGAWRPGTRHQRTAHASPGRQGRAGVPGRHRAVRAMSTPHEVLSQRTLDNVAGTPR